MVSTIFVKPKVLIMRSHFRLAVMSYTFAFIKPTDYLSTCHPSTLVLTRRTPCIRARHWHKNKYTNKLRCPQVFFLITAALTATIKTYRDRGCHAVRTRSSLRLKWTSPSPQTTNIPSAISVVGTKALPPQLCCCALHFLSVFTTYPINSSECASCDQYSLKKQINDI